MLNIQWYPGHMNKTRKILIENLRLVDIVVELLDARAPESSKNPKIDEIVGKKIKITVLNKFDLADENILNIWNSKFDDIEKGIPINSVNGSGIDSLLKRVNDLMSDKFERDKSKGKIGKTSKLMIVGIPNVGKSSLINRLSGRATAKTGNKPGVTKIKQWIRIKEDVQLLDTPGILWPKFEDEEIGLNLAFTGAIKDEIIDLEELALKLIERLKKLYFENLKNRYKIEVNESTSIMEIYESIAIKRGYFLSKKQIDYFRTAKAILDDFRNGKLGKITLERY